MYDIRVHVLNEMIFLYIFHVPFWVVTLVQGIRCVACRHAPWAFDFWLFPCLIWSFMSPYQYVLRIDGHTHTNISLSLSHSVFICVYIYIHMHSFIFYLFLHIWSQFVISYVCCTYVTYVTWQHVRHVLRHWLFPKAAEAAGLHFAGENALQRRWAVHGWC